MKLSRRDTRACKALSDELGIPVSEVRKAVVSYFDSIVSAARKLPFDNLNRIYSKEAFTEKSFIEGVTALCGRRGNISVFGRRYIPVFRGRGSAVIRMRCIAVCSSPAFRALVLTVIIICAAVSAYHIGAAPFLLQPVYRL